MPLCEIRESPACRAQGTETLRSAPLGVSEARLRLNPVLWSCGNGHASLCVFPNKISGYTLTVQASDNGSPPRVTTTTVNIDVSDVNDNAPVFSRENYSLIIQVTVGPGFLEYVLLKCVLSRGSIVRSK